MTELVIGSLRIRDQDTTIFGQNGEIVGFELLPAGWRMEGHKHLFDHMTYIACGKFEAWQYSDAEFKQDRKLVAHTIITGPAALNISANCYHEFLCLEPGILHCIFAARDPETHEVVTQPNTWAQASGLYEKGLAKKLGIGGKHGDQ